MKDFTKIENIKKTLIPLVILVVIFILTIFSLKIIFENFTRLNSELSDNNKTTKILQEKLSSLQTVTPSLSSQANDLIVALPPTDSALGAISQLQFQSFQSGIALDSLQSQANFALPTSTINSTEVDFNGSGNYSNIVDFISKLNSSLPITSFNNLDIKNDNPGVNGAFHFTAALVSYWYPLPSTLPAITEPLVKLTQEELKTVSEISLESASSSGNLVNASSSGVIGKTNPFQ